MPHLLTPLVLVGLLALPQSPAAVRVPEVLVSASADRADASSSLRFVPIEHAASSEAVLDTPRPTEWMERVRRCHRRGRRSFCDGPRMVPMPFGVDAARAIRLGLHERGTTAKLLFGRPEARWVEAVGSKSHARLRYPVDQGRLGRGVGYNRRSEIRNVRHEGVDIGAPIGTPVRAVEDALVGYADNTLRGYGNCVILVHPDGSTSLYAHLRSAYVFAGQRIRRGQVLGEIGMTGLSYGPHLHFEWRLRGRVANPVPRFDRIPDVPPLARRDELLASR